MTCPTENQRYQRLFANRCGSSTWDGCLMDNAESHGVKIQSMHLISSADTTFRKAKAEKQTWRISYPSALAVTTAWEVSSQLTNGIRSLRLQKRCQRLDVCFVRWNGFGISRRELTPASAPSSRCCLYTDVLASIQGVPEGTL